VENLKIEREVAKATDPISDGERSIGTGTGTYRDSISIVNSAYKTLQAALEPLRLPILKVGYEMADISKWDYANGRVKNAVAKFTVSVLSPGGVVRKVTVPLRIANDIIHTPEYFENGQADKYRLSKEGFEQFFDGEKPKEDYSVTKKDSIYELPARQEIPQDRLASLNKKAAVEISIYKPSEQGLKKGFKALVVFDGKDIWGYDSDGFFREAELAMIVKKK